MPRPLRRIAVFCGSRPGARPDYLEAARALGAALGRRRIGLVYGGASIGLMGALADAALAQGGEVVGVIPQRLVDREIAHAGLSEQHVVHSMHERKATMERLSDGFIALPGGFGTFDELFEIVTWLQLGIHHKPVGLLDVSGYYGALRALVDRGVAEGFIPAEHATTLHFAQGPDALIDALLAAPPPPPTPSALDRSQT